jgi:mRNA-degrading endonuclease RelE of RelBE toxin-antitoxin system
MQDLERYLLWGAIVVLFFLILMPRMSGYIGEPHSITKLTEFSGLDVELLKLYNDNVIPVMIEYGKTISKFWKDLPSDTKTQLTTELKKELSRLRQNAIDGRQMNGKDVLEKMKGRGVDTKVPIQEAAKTPSPAVINKPDYAYKTPAPMKSTYMVEPFMPMVSGFSLQDAMTKLERAVTF